MGVAKSSPNTPFFKGIRRIWWSENYTYPVCSALFCLQKTRHIFLLYMSVITSEGIGFCLFLLPRSWSLWLKSSAPLHQQGSLWKKTTVGFGVRSEVPTCDFRSSSGLVYFQCHNSLVCWLNNHTRPLIVVHHVCPKDWSWLARCQLMLEIC